MRTADISRPIPAARLIAHDRHHSHPRSRGTRRGLFARRAYAPGDSTGQTEKAAEWSKKLERFAKVETRMLESEAQLRDDPIAHANFKRDAIERLVRLYEAWSLAAPAAGKAESAATWKQRLASPRKAAAPDLKQNEGK
jgi:hypothetical protein